MLSSAFSIVDNHFLLRCGIVNSVKRTSNSGIRNTRRKVAFHTVHFTVHFSF